MLVVLERTVKGQPVMRVHRASRDRPKWMVEDEEVPVKALEVA